MFHLLRAIIRLNPKTGLIPMVSLPYIYFVANAISADDLCLTV